MYNHLSRYNLRSVNNGGRIVRIQETHPWILVERRKLRETNGRIPERVNTGCHVSPSPKCRDS